VFRTITQDKGAFRQLYPDGTGHLPCPKFVSLVPPERKWKERKGDLLRDDCATRTLFCFNVTVSFFFFFFRYSLGWFQSLVRWVIPALLKLCSELQPIQKRGSYYESKSDHWLRHILCRQT
jgi:hypothetical protein